MLALSLLAGACGDDAKPKTQGGHVGAGDGDGDAQDDGGSRGGDGGPSSGDGDGDQPGSMDAGDGDVELGLDAGDDAEVPDPFEGLPDAGDNAGPDGSVISEDDRLALAVEAKLRKCGTVVGEGPFNVGLVEDDYDRCVGSCVVNSSCSNLTRNLCGGETNAYGNCTANCSTRPADGFLCNDGSRIRHTAVCDDDLLAKDAKCPGGEDELNCEKFTCKDGDKISMKYRCDGTSVEGAKASILGCKDGSDEVGCAVACPAPPAP